MKSVRALIALGLLALAGGCHRSSLPPQANADEARVALNSALEAWQRGETWEAMAARTPPLYFNDPKCLPEVKLLNYKIEEGHEYHGLTVRLRTVLTLRVNGEEMKDKKYRYLIDTSPNMVIVSE